MQTNTGSTALILAANDGHYKIMELLIKAGADIFIKNKAGQTALQILQEFTAKK